MILRRGSSPTEGRAIIGAFGESGRLCSLSYEDLQKINVSELKEDLKQSEIRLKDLSEAAELAFKVIKEKENIVLNEISALREEIKKRSGRG